ncbi:hypothetical protein C7999DRAFT_12209 [Corynascus novoguineensis]|uniref:Uncharacterized protein n=1 Tax=Corynascus novoguineensis TaxID=1126955 RepID=A0AAN7CXP4_9PEZI|nr:hypothetical protein C7999DRAFT_12209 [Corynascus novoguineensis]
MPEVQGWSAAQIVTVGVFNAATFAALLAIVCDSLGLWQRARETVGKLDNAVAELGVQQGRFTELQQEVNRRDAFISRNLLEGSEAVAAAVLGGVSRQYQEPCPKPALDDVSVVGSNVEHSNNVVGDRGNGDGGVEPTRDVAVEPALCASAISARQHPKEGQRHRGKINEVPKNRDAWIFPQEGEQQALIDRYWDTSAIGKPQEAPRPAENEIPTEVEAATTEVDQTDAGTNDVNAIQGPIASWWWCSSTEYPGGPERHETPPTRRNAV